MFRRVGLCAIAVAMLSACGSGVVDAPPRSPVIVSTAPLEPIAVDETGYAESAYQVLLAREGTPVERMNLLAGVVRHQLARANDRFAAGYPEAGLWAFTGAALMLRAGEHRTEIFEGSTEVLKRVVEQFARQGNEGQSTAIYKWLVELAKTDAQRTDAIAHLDALESWNESLRKFGPLQAAGARQSLLVQQSLLDSREEVLLDASDGIVAWMHRALEADLGRLPIRTPAERDEALEAYRAIKGGGVTLLGVMLRHGRLKLALDIIEKQDLTGVVPPALVSRIEAAAFEDEPSAWAELFGLFNSIQSPDGPDGTVDAGVARGAAWGAALELHRSAPESAEGAKPLALELVSYGMPEVATLMLGRVFGSQPAVDDLSWALGLVMRVMIAEDDVGNLNGARRVFEEAKPLLTTAASKAYRKGVQPSVARLDYVMGALELRAAHLDRALPLFERAAKREPTTAVLESLAAIHRQRGETSKSMAVLERASKLADSARKGTVEARVLLTLADVIRESHQNGLEAVLARALEVALGARQTARTNAEQAEIERLLAQIFDRYGLQEEARQAMARAYELSRSHHGQLTATVLDAAKRALTYQDLAASRDAVHEAIDADLEDDDIVYVALWLRLVELRLGAPSDGSVERALGRIDDGARWPAALRDWGLGRIDAAALNARARGLVEQTEVRFYETMAVWKGAGVPAPLREVARSEAVELIEVAIARELVVGKDRPSMKLSLPEGVELP